MTKKYLILIIVFLTLKTYSQIRVFVDGENVSVKCYDKGTNYIKNSFTFNKNSPWEIEKTSYSFYKNYVLRKSSRDTVYDSITFNSLGLIYKEFKITNDKKNVLYSICNYDSLKYGIVIKYHYSSKMISIYRYDSLGRLLRRELIDSLEGMNQKIITLRFNNYNYLPCKNYEIRINQAFPYSVYSPKGIFIEFGGICAYLPDESFVSEDRELNYCKYTYKRDKNNYPINVLTESYEFRKESKNSNLNDTTLVRAYFKEKSENRIYLRDYTIHKKVYKYKTKSKLCNCN